MVKDPSGIELAWYSKGWDDAKKKWQGLSDDEITNCTLDKLADDYDIKFARAIEQALKEKNGR